MLIAAPAERHRRPAAMRESGPALPVWQTVVTAPCRAPYASVMRDEKKGGRSALFRSASFQGMKRPAPSPSPRTSTAAVELETTGPNDTGRQASGSHAAPACYTFILGNAISKQAPPSGRLRA